MIRLINDAMRWAVFWWYMSICSWLYISGRLYIFRNVPTWVIEQLVASNAKSKKPLIDGDGLHFLKQAQGELRLRSFQRERTHQEG